MMTLHVSDARFIALAAAFALTIATFLIPRITVTRPVYDIMAVVDMTGSMNTRDGNTAAGSRGKPQTRLDAAKAAVRDLLAELPCQSRLGLAVFSERRTFVLFNPVEVCENFSPIDTAITSLDWRMAWEGDSLVAKGLHHGITEAALTGADIVFLTDGHEAPPLPPPGNELPPFEGKPGEVKGVIAGVGGHDKSPIPKFDDDGNETGVFGPMDVDQANHTGPPPKDAEKLPGYHPKWAPFGNAAPVGDEHLSSVRSKHLTALAAQTGLIYRGLSETPRLFGTIKDAARTRRVAVPVDVRPLPAAVALALLCAVYAAPLVIRAAGWVPFNKAGQIT